MGQIETALDSANQSSSPENSDYGKRKQDDCSPDNKIFKIPKLAEASISNKETLKKYNRTLSELLNQSDMDVIFDEIENSICQMGISQEILSPTHDNVLEMLCENDNPLESEQDKSLFNISSANLSFGSIFKKKLMKNASKSVLEQNEEVGNISLAEEVVKFQELGPFFGLPTKVKDLIKLYKGIDELYGELTVFFY